MIVTRPVAVALLLVSARALAGQSGPSATCRSGIPLSPAGATGTLESIGASIGVIDSAALAPLVSRTLSEALTARLPGVSVMRSSGVAGTGSRIRLRGPSGILMTEQPVLFIDGIRVEGEAQSIGVNAGGQAPSRLDDVAVEDVECIYVLRGPAAAARYGTDAAGGVIHVVTRAARTDSARVHAFVEGGATTGANDYPANYGTGPAGPNGTTNCTRARAALGQCVAGPVRSWSPTDANSPFRTAPLLHAGGRATILAGHRLSIGASGSGTVDDGALRKNEHRSYAGGVGAGFRPDSNLDVRADLWLAGGHASLPQVGNFIYSILNSALLGSSVDDPVRRGYRSVPLSVLEEFGTDQRVRRLGGVARVAWKPRAWLSLAALAGREDALVRDEQLDPFVRLQPGGFTVIPPSTVVTAERRGQRTSAGASAAATYGPAAVRLTSEVAVDYLAETRRLVGRAFDPTGQSADFSYRWSAHDATTKGVVVRQVVAWNDRRFLEGGVRHDVLDGDFRELENPTYPFANIAWDIAREPFFGSGGAVSSLRVRAAYGESGDSRPYEAALALALTGVSSGAPVGAPPVERAREVEGGADLGLFNDRLALAATYFTRRTTNGLVMGAAPPSVGGPVSALLNAASWRTSGAELALRAQLLDRRTIRAGVAMSFTSLTNEVTSLGGLPPMIATSYRIVPGYPLYGAWGQAFTVVDANGDGVIVPAEVIADTASRYLGSSVPTRELGVTPSVVLARSITVSALVDYRGGFRSSNAGGRLRCNAVCAALYVPNASIADQARAVDPTDAAAAWVEDASFVKLRELSVAWAIPATWSRRLGAPTASLTLAGRNLATRTSYSGLDPEVAANGQADINQVDLFTLPLPRTFSLRLDARW